MAQRARNHDTNVYAFQASDELWRLWKQEAKDGRLTLPCCGGTAVPREHPVSGTRFFSHAPYAARTCDWKATGALHEDLVNEACSILDKLGWKVETDCWIDNVSIDILATHPANGDQVALMIETASKADRPDDVLISENERLHHTELRSALWLVPSSRIGILDYQLIALPYQKTSDYSENTIRMVADLLHQWFDRIDEIVPMQVTADNSRKRLRDIHQPHGPAPSPDASSAPPTRVDQDPEWHDGHGSVGSPRARADRLIRMAHRWLGDAQADLWLQQSLADLECSPVEAAQTSATGYLQAQDALKGATLSGKGQTKLL